jgi:hypothetical protein
MTELFDWDLIDRSFQSFSLCRGILHQVSGRRPTSCRIDVVPPLPAGESQVFPSLPAHT